MAKLNLAVVDYPGLVLRALAVELPRPLESLPSPPWLTAWLDPAAAAPLQSSAALRMGVRDLLRQRGYRPTGRGKPSSEYLAAALADGRLGSINAAVDAGNAASLHSGLPISIVDLALCRPPLSVDVPPAGSKYVFNRGGQEIDVGGLLCLGDTEGPIANAVKDAQRTKTLPSSVRLLGVVWGAAVPDERPADATVAWLGELFTQLGARVEAVSQRPLA